MKLTLDGTPEEIRHFLLTPGGAILSAAAGAVAPAAMLSGMMASKSSHFAPRALQAVASNADTLHKVQSMIRVHEDVFAAADFSKEAMTSVIHPEIQYYEFNKLVSPSGVDGVARRFAEFHNVFKFDKINNLLTFGDGEYLANVYEVEATHVGEHEGVEATHKPVKIGGIGVMRVQNGMITEYRDAYDVSGLVPQVEPGARRGKRS
jgi:SnoaL-like polyketide cyclase